MDFQSKTSDFNIVPLIFRLANNYKLLDQAEFKQFIQQ